MKSSGYILWIEFKDGAEMLYFLSGLIEKNELFHELGESPDLFTHVQVDAGGYGISWNDEIDMSAEELWANGIPIKTAYCLAPGCDCPICGQKIKQESPKLREAYRGK